MLALDPPYSCLLPATSVAHHVFITAAVANRRRVPSPLLQQLPLDLGVICSSRAIRSLVTLQMPPAPQLRLLEEDPSYASYYDAYEASRRWTGCRCLCLICCGLSL